MTPALVLPLNLGSLLKLNHGRAWVGFTAATGHSTWQTQVSGVCGGAGAGVNGVSVGLVLVFFCY